jgi:tetratricopeptide (TPR) repeat protein
MVVPAAPTLTDLRPQLQRFLGAAYTIERELGGGGMSRVFVATENALGRQVVVKVLSQELAGGLSAERFNREIQLAARLQHPNIVPVLSAGDAGGVPFYTMPLVEGESLRAKIARDGELPVRHAVAVLRDVARALEYAHAHNVVHRDIKPDNVLLASDYAVVTDFGVAKALIAAQTPSPDGSSASLTQLGVAIGTPAYMSPEQVAGDTVDHRADLYSFGCTAYEALTGTPPFSGANAQALMAAHANRTPVALTEVRPAISPGLAQLVMRCMEKRPADRPQSAREIIDVLDAVGTPATGGIPSVLVDTQRRRRPLLLAGLGLALAVAVGVVLFAPRAKEMEVRQNVVAVTPFRVAGADPSLGILREGMLDLISAKLTGAVSSVDPRTVLSAWRARGGSDASDPVAGDALAVATDLHAGRLLRGEIVGTPQRMVISATLLAVPEGRTRATATVTGAQADVALLVDSLVSELFAQEAGRTTDEARQLAGTPWPALQAYLLGQSLYRHGRYDEAEDAFGRALEADSTFALAGIAFAVTDGWTQKGRYARGVGVALRAYDHLGPRERVLLNGVDPRWLRGYRGACAEREAIAEQNASEHTDMPEAWYFLGDQLFHCGAVTSSGEDASRRSLAAFQRALAIDSTFTPAREHLPHLYAFLGDTAAERAQLDRMRADSSDLLDVWRFLLGAMPDSTERRAFADRSLSRTGRTPFFVPSASLTTPYQVDGERVMQGLIQSAATRREQVQLAELERQYALDRGQPARAAQAARRANAAPSVSLLDAVFWDGDSTAAADALPVALRAYTSMPAADSASAWSDNIYAVAQYELAHGDTSHARAAITLLRQPPPASPLWVGDRRRQWALLLEAQLASTTKRPDAAEVLRQADSLSQIGPATTLVQNASAVIVTRLWEQRAQLDRAWAASKREKTFPGMSYLSTLRLERARIGAALGQRHDAIEQYRRYLAMRYAPEPSLQSQVDAVRKELARLESASR